MRVNPSSNNPSVDSIRPAADAPKQAGAGSAAGAAGGVDRFARSGDLSRLLSSLAESPDVRDDVLATVRAKIEAGELGTRSALAEAATGIVDGAGE